MMLGKVNPLINDTQKSSSSMHWFCETPSLQQIDPAWPALPDTAMALLPKRHTGSELLGAERVLAQQMGDSRLVDFAAGRACAHLAQKHLGLSAQPILRNERAPVWPKGQCGSISHAKDWALAAVSTSLRGIGVDVEAQGRVTQKLYRALFRPGRGERFLQRFRRGTKRGICCERGRLQSDLPHCGRLYRLSGS